MKKIFLCELKASKFTQSRTFNDKKLPKGFSHHLHSLLVELRNKDPDNFPTNVSTRKFHVAIEFLLFFLGDVPNHVIDGKRLNELLAKIGVLVGDILYVIQMHLLADEAGKIELSTIKIMEKIEDLKAQVEERYYQSFVYSPSQFPTAVISERELSSLTSVFGDVAKVQYDHDILKDLLERTINLAYEAEVAIDFIFVQYNALWHSFCSLPAIINEIKHIRAEVIKMRSENLARKPYFVVEPSKHLPTQQSNLMSDEEIVGFEDDTEIIIQYLIRGTNDLDVIPIVGMGGQGKTTCAKKLYNDDIIVSRFDVRAWCTISQSYNWRELLQEIFSQTTGSKDKGDKDDILADEVRKILMGKRYLIVLEDIWDSKAWDDLSLCFPDVGNRSRILVTTRLEKVGEHVKHYTDLYFLPFLTLDESCRLLYSFKMGMFPEDARIPVSKLISLWIAEGFVQNTESGRLEETAEEYLMDLISSNVVMISKRGYNGKVKYCQVHDIVLQFCLEKSREEKFLLAVKLSESQFQASRWKGSRVSCSFSNGPSMFSSLGSIRGKPFHQKLSSLITTSLVEFYNWDPFQQFVKLRILKVLDLSSHKVKYLSSAQRCPNLQELDVTVTRGDGCERVQFNLESFTRLQILRLFVDRILSVSKLYLPSNLKKLVVRADIKERTISDIEELPHLEYLQLWDANCFQDRKWCLGDITFCKLKVMKLVKLGISRWDASEESFPLLETLVIKQCEELEEIPLSFADIPTLEQNMSINKKNESLESSALRIKKEVQDIEGCERINIITKDWWGNQKHLFTIRKVHADINASIGCFFDRLVEA
ncbi:hypothetical protein CQW23_23019 [Capsicum baccatum]|uniref:Uncharacterized protein n=1 Tax=Capsicum baccatum TaxID=33114 RepID=A0A2G2W2I7_CAPBA|nr:hypothetical protein CQW23_23019 [Capsicum baccatum]